MIAPTLLAAAMFSSQVPASQRVEKLTPLFDPPPHVTNSKLRLEPRELREFKPNSALKLRGFIQVTPPKGHCLTITPSVDDEEDFVVCKSTRIAFRIEDLDRFGRLKWRVSTGEGDFGTDLVWSTPYRLAQVTPFGQTAKDPPQYRVIERCEATTTPAIGRRIQLHFVDGTVWTIRFPDQDTGLPQPEPLPNLPTQLAKKPGAIPKDAAKEAASAEHGSGEGKKTEDKVAGEHGEAATAPVEPEKISEEKDRSDWHLPLRDSYEMSSAYFQPNGSVTPGIQGTCRYRYLGLPEDPEVGRIECHEADLYHFMYAPLTCMAKIKS